MSLEGRLVIWNKFLVGDISYLQLLVLVHG